MMNGRWQLAATRHLVLLVLCAVPVAAAEKTGVPPAKARPNVVLFLADDLGYGDVGVHGNGRVRTPNLDAFARQAIELEQFRVSPVCAPTRASLMTGRYSFRGGVCDVFGKACEMDSGEVTIAEALRSAGYATGMFGKWHLGAAPDHSPNAQGFEEALYFPGPAMRPKEYFDPSPLHNGRPEQRKGYCMDVFADAAIEFVRQHKGRPFFLYLAPNLIHAPLIPPEGSAKPFADAGASESTAKAYGMIQSLDAAFGRVRAALAELGIEEDTFLMFASDNGPCSSSAPLDRHMAGLHGLKGTVYDNGIRVPCFVRWPREFKGPAKVSQQLAHIDVMPTVLDACGAGAPEGLLLDGRSMMPLLRQANAEWKDRTLFFQWDSGQRPRRGHAYAVLTERWKLVQPAGMDAPNQKHIRDRYAELCRLQGRGERSIEGEPRYELYEIGDDPRETNDLASQHPDVVADMRRQYDRWFDDTGSRWQTGARVAEMLRAWLPDHGLTPLQRAEKTVQEAAADDGGRAEMARELAGVLAGKAAPPAKRFACEQLAIVGGEAELGALAELLGDADLGAPARGAIEKIGGRAAAAVLRAAYEKTESPAARAGLLGSLAKLRDGDTIPLASAAMGAESAPLRESARIALGRIGGRAATEALLQARVGPTGTEAQSWADALLACAEGLGDCRNGKEAEFAVGRQALDRLLGKEMPAGIRAAAFAAKVRMAGEEGAALAIQAMRGDDGALLNGALLALAANGGERLARWHDKIIEAQVGITASARNRLLDIYGSMAMRGGVRLAERMMADESPEIRQKALRLLGQLGAEPEFDALFARLVGAADEEREAAADGLSKLRATSTAGRLLALLPVIPAHALPAVIDIFARRTEKAAIPALLSLARAGDPATAKAAIRALGELVDADAIPGLVDVVEKRGPASAGAAQLLAKITRAQPEQANVRLATALATASEPTQGVISRIMALAAADVAGFGRNLAIGAKAESPTGLKADGASKGPMAAIDGNQDTYWDEENGQPEYRLRITLPKQEVISWLRITGYRQQDYAPKDFLILCDSREIKRVAGAEYADNKLLIDLPPSRCTVLELVITGYYGGSPAIRELEIFGDTKASGDRKAPPAGLSWDRRQDSLALMSGGKTVWRFVHGADQAFPHFDPLALVGGDNLVWKSPKDHIHHYAHWFSWKIINGVNYWEFDKSTGRPVGETRCSDVSAETRPDGSAKVTMKIAYAPPGGPAVLSENRTLELSPPGKEGDYHIDWRMEWTAGGEPVSLERTPPPGEPDGKPHGGYGGLSVRFAEAFKEWTVVNSDGMAGMDGHGKRAPASDFGGTIGGRECGIAIVEHPSNRNAPTPWFLVMNPQAPFGYTNPAFLFDSAKRIGPGEKLLLRYRVIVHWGRWDPPALKRALAAYAKEVP